MPFSLGSTSSSPAWNHALLLKLFAVFSSERNSLEHGLHSHPLPVPHPLSYLQEVPWWLLAVPLCWKCWPVSKVWPFPFMSLEPLPSLPKLTAALFPETCSATSFWSAKVAAFLVKLSSASHSQRCPFLSWNGLHYRGVPSSGPSWPKQFPLGPWPYFLFVFNCIVLILSGS